jgi:large subunit ribosomal protein L22
MEAKATAKYVRMSPRKVRFVIDTIRGKYADEALAQLQFTPNHAAAEIAKVLRSAVANAENNHDMNSDVLKVTRCYVDPGPTLKRVQPRAQGRAYRILKRTSHITVVVEEAERRVRRPKAAPRPPRPPLRAGMLAPSAPVETVEERDETASAPATETPETPAAAEAAIANEATVTTEVTAGEAAPTDATASAPGGQEATQTNQTASEDAEATRKEAGA